MNFMALLPLILKFLPNLSELVMPLLGDLLIAIGTQMKQNPGGAMSLVQDLQKVGIIKS